METVPEALEHAERPNMDDDGLTPSSSEQFSRDELNLAEFPIALLSERVPHGVKTLEFQDEIYDQKRKQVVIRKLTVTGSDKFGLPTAKDDEVILGLIHLTKQANNFSDRKVRFRRSDLIKLLGWPDTGPSYRRLSKSFACWLGVTLYYENSWWDKQTGTWITKGFHIIDGFEIADSGTTGQMSLLPSEFTWNETVFKNFQSGYLKRIDLDFYLNLRHATSKRMYRFLDKRFFHRPDWTFSLRDFACEHIGLSRDYSDAGKIKEKLQPAFDELEGIGFLEPMSREERYTKVGPGEWKIHLRRKAIAKALVKAEAKKEKQPQRADAKELVSRGVTATTAEGLVAAHPRDRIDRQIEVFDWLVQTKDKRVSKSPAGYLVESIRDDYAAPKGYVSKADRAKRVADEEARRKKLEESKKRAEAEQQAREEAEQKRIADYLKSLTADEREALETEALANANAFFLQQYRRAKGNPASEAMYRKLIVDTHVTGILEAEGTGR